MRKRRKSSAIFWLSVLCAAGFWGCGGSDSSPPNTAGGAAALPSPSPTGGTVCTEVYVYGINLRITAPSGQPISDAKVVIRDGAYAETLKSVDSGEPIAGEPVEDAQGPSTGIYQGAGERPGNYTVTITAPGYAPLQLENLLVKPGTCHVTPVSRQVVLTPS